MGVDQRAVTGSTSARRIGSLGSLAAARAIRTASSAVRRTSASDTMFTAPGILSTAFGARVPVPWQAVQMVF
jgi:hypothetical protein